jgi:hypothetical protein
MDSHQGPVSLALRRISLDLVTHVAIIAFHDGYVYRASPVYEQDLWSLLEPGGKPGSWFNTTLKLRSGFTAERLDKWPDSFPTRSIQISFPPPDQAGITQRIS